MPYRLMIVTFFAAFVAIVLGALTAANSVPSSKAGQVVQPIDANALAPAACAGMGLVDVVTGSGKKGTITGTNGNDLILGTSGNDKINGGQGNDCIVGGAGTDTINGGPGTDVCLGNSTTTFKNCP